MAACKATAGTYQAAIASGDPAKIAAQYTADGTLTTPEGTFQGRRAITAYEAAFVKPGVSNEDAFKTARRVGGNAIRYSGGYTFTFMRPSTEPECLTMVQLVLTFCLLASDRSCVERRPTPDDTPGLMGCMTAAQPLAAEFVRSHPAFRLVSWRCEIGKLPEKAA